MDDPADDEHHHGDDDSHQGLLEPSLIGRCPARGVVHREPNDQPETHSLGQGQPVDVECRDDKPVPQVLKDPAPDADTDQSHDGGQSQACKEADQKHGQVGKVPPYPVAKIFKQQCLLSG